MTRLEKGMRFVIICAPRTGSSHLVSVLSGHPELLVSGNIFDDRKRKRLYVFWPQEELTPEVKAELLDLRKSDPEAFLEHIFNHNFGRRHVGFKIFKGENDDILDRIMRDSDIRKVVLYRRNVLANFSSALVARKTGQYGLKEGKPTGEVPKIKFSEERFIKFHNKYASFFQFVTSRLNALGQEFCFLSYEDINEPHVLANLVTFLGGDPGKPMLKENQFKRQTKQNSSDILSRFSNAYEVEGFLRRHDLLHWMHEGELCFSPSSFDVDALKVASGT
jgi:LPS sulfotransferase NodH